MKTSIKKIVVGAILAAAIFGATESANACWFTCRWFGGCRSCATSTAYSWAICSANGTCRASGRCASGARPSTTCADGVCRIEEPRTALIESSPVPCADGSCAVSQAPQAAPLPQDDASAFVALVNRYRCSCAPLRLSTAQEAGCRAVAADNAACGYARHPFPVPCAEVCAPGATAQAAVSIFSSSGAHWGALTNSGYRNISVVRVGNFWAARLW